MDCGMLDYWWCPGCKFVGESYPRSEPPRIIAPQFANTFFFSAYYLLHFSFSPENDSTFLLLSTQN